MSKPIPSVAFREGMRERLMKVPFDRISAYKVRETQRRLQRELQVVESIAAYLKAPPRHRYAAPLLGCAPGDIAVRLRQIPANVARYMGRDLTPALDALTLEGVPEADVDAFVASIKPRVKKLIAGCDVAQAATAGPISAEYRALKAGHSTVPRICAEAISIADEAALFCRRHGV